MAKRLLFTCTWIRINFPVQKEREGSRGEIISQAHSQHMWRAWRTYVPLYKNSFLAPNTHTTTIPAIQKKRHGDLWAFLLYFFKKWCKAAALCTRFKLDWTRDRFFFKEFPIIPPFPWFFFAPISSILVCPLCCICTYRTHTLAPGDTETKEDWTRPGQQHWPSEPSSLLLLFDASPQDIFSGKGGQQKRWDIQIQRKKTSIDNRKLSYSICPISPIIKSYNYLHACRESCRMFFRRRVFLTRWTLPHLI